MQTIYENALLLGSAQGIFLSFLLLRTTAASPVARVLLSALTLAFSLDLAVTYLEVTGFTLVYPRLAFYGPLVVYLYGPLLYLYVKAMAGGPAWRFRAASWLHFGPALLALFLLTPAFLLRDRELVSVLSGEAGIARYLGHWSAVLSWVDVVPRILIGVYLVLGFRTLAIHVRTIRDHFSEIEQLSLQWLRNLLLGITGLYILYFLAPVIEDSMTVDRFLNIFTAIVVYVLGYMGLQRPAVFTGREPGFVPGGLQRTAASDPAPGERKQKYEGSALDEESAGALFSELQELMERERPYLKPDLSLGELAKRMNLPLNYVSQVINQQAGCNFFDYVNSYRVRAAKEALLDPTEAGANILTLAMDAGFNSKSAFYAAFKQNTGMTPTQFRKSSAS